jgi:hypothetical protein
MTPNAADWYWHDHADAYLLAAAFHLARATTTPLTRPLPQPSVSATLYCAFAAEAYINVALIRILSEDEYKPVSEIGVRTKYYLATRLGRREVWFSAGEQVLKDLDELFTQRNRLSHAQPETSTPNPDLHNDLTNVARWLAATADAVQRLSQSDAELSSLARVAGPLSEMEPILRSFQPERDGPVLDDKVRALMRDLLKEDEEPFVDDDHDGPLRPPDARQRGAGGGAAGHLPEQNWREYWREPRRFG